MDMLKKFFPYSLGVKSVVDLVIKIIVYVVVGALVGVVLGLVGLVPFIGPIIAWVLGTVCELYVLIGIIVAVLDFLKVLK